ncbi:hypothetical protein KSP39_PZI023836 [Platanthera zijinensis]|uniref:Transmembrane protein n=1 Tax=Platanthera zijinensis TaxID=2320716 RepID=A0AAP0FSU3_9ASPA
MVRAEYESSLWTYFLRETLLPFLIPVVLFCFVRVFLHIDFSIRFVAEGIGVLKRTSLSREFLGRDWRYFEVVVEMRSGGDADFVIDLENSPIVTAVNAGDAGDGKKFFNKVWSGLVGCDGSNRGEEAMEFENRLNKFAEIQLENGEAMSVYKKIGGVEKPKKKGYKKPPKPPRPPRPLSVDLADQKLVREITEIAMLKRARVERMRALKKTKNGKGSASSAGNGFALLITLVFCIVIIWQGIFSRGSPTTSFQGSPESIETAANGGSFVSIQFYSNASTNNGISAASPRNAGFESETDEPSVERMASS